MVFNSTSSAWSITWRKTRSTGLTTGALLPYLALKVALSMSLRAASSGFVTGLRREALPLDLAVFDLPLKTPPFWTDLAVFWQQAK